MANIVNGHDLDTQSGRADLRAEGGHVEGNPSGGYTYTTAGGQSGSGGGSQAPTQGATYNTGGSTGPAQNQPAPGNQGQGLNALLTALQAGDTRAFDEFVRQFNQNFGLQVAGLTGTYNGAPTLPAMTSYATQFGTWGVPTAGQSTLAAQNQTYNQQMGMINSAAALQANPFRQQQVLGQMGSLLGGGGVAGFQAPNTVAGVGTAGGNTRGGMGYLQQMIDDIRDPSANTATMNQVMQAIPTPNKLNSNEFLRAAPSTQNMVLQGMQEKYGLDPNDALRQIQNTLPQFRAPTTMGGVRR